MSNVSKTSAGLLGCAAGFALLANVASATPATHALALRNAVPSTIETVRWGGWGWGLGGFAAGAIIGSALVAPYYYGGYYPYAYPYYPPPPPVAAYGGPAGGAASCAQRYKSYDPATGTFLGYDGARHPCP